MMPPTPAARFLLPLLLAALLAAAGCDSGSNDGGDTTIPDTLRSRTYALAAMPNSGSEVPDGVSGRVTFWEVSSGRSIVTLELEGGPTGAPVAHVAHIHENTASEGGPIAIRLSPIDGSGGTGTSARLVDRSYDALVDFDGYVNVHESVHALDVVIAQGNIGRNAAGTGAAGFDFVNRPRVAEFSLTAQSNDGALPTGLGGRILFQEIEDSLTIATLDIGLDGTTGTPFSHPAHIHANSAEEGGSILTYLAPLDASDPETRSSVLIEASIDSLATMDGYVNIHESIDSLGTVISQGNIGANAN